MARRARFEFRRVLTPVGFLRVPIARLQLMHGDNAMDVEMAIDSGADLSMIPYQVGVNLGLARSRAALRNLSGVAGALRYDLHRLRIRLGPFDFRARVAWVQRDDVPMLLGRADVFDRFKVIFDERRNIITFAE